MNTDAHYERFEHLPMEQQHSSPPTEAEQNHLARAHDPSLQRTPGAGRALSRPGSITWVRPSELATTIGTPMLRSTQALPTTPLKRLRRPAPHRATRVSRAGIARPQPTTTHEGLGL